MVFGTKTIIPASMLNSFSWNLQARLTLLSIISLLKDTNTWGTRLACCPCISFKLYIHYVLKIKSFIPICFSTTPPAVSTLSPINSTTKFKISFILQVIHDKSRRYCPSRHTERQFSWAILPLRKPNFIPFRKPAAGLLRLQSRGQVVKVCQPSRFLLASTCLISLTAVHCLVGLFAFKDLHWNSQRPPLPLHTQPK